MDKLKEKIEKSWASLLNQRSQNYLVRSKIDQNIAIANSNLSASFMGNRQLANHNTADIKYNFTKPRIGKGSCIFVHLTQDYKPTAGCIALKKKDFLILLKLIKPQTKIKIS